MIKWNEYTWYSRLASAIFFLLVFPALSFYLGMQFGEITAQVVVPVVESMPTSVEENTEAVTERFSARVDRVDVIFEQKDYTSYRLTTNELVREGELNTERGFGDDVDATVYVLNWQKPEGERMYYVRLTSDPTHLYALDGNREILKGSALTLEP